jgi:hypothetical protein
MQASGSLEGLMFLACKDGAQRKNKKTPSDFDPGHTA